MQINRCYDSHLHLLPTGIFLSGLRLFGIRSIEDLSQIELKPDYFRGEWLVGFGWDQHLFVDQKYPTRQQLDQIFPDYPVALTRADGHAIWLNTKAVEKAGYLNSHRAVPDGGIVLRDDQGVPTGIFIESAKLEIDFMLPKYSKLQNKLFLQEAIAYLNRQGFTHAREMTASAEMWTLLREMDLYGQLSLYVECNFVCENFQDYERAKAELQMAQQTQTQHLKACGVKLFFDGALGSEGALISDFYQSGVSHKKNKGLALWSLKDVEIIMRDLWMESQNQLAIHTIGDEAVSQIVGLAERVQKELGGQGELHIEHGEIIRPETIEQMKQLRVRVHMQPCHWLSDRRWLQEKIPSLSRFVFPWRSLQQAGIAFDWGSDTPIEEASVANNLKALKEAADNGVAMPIGELHHWHQHPDLNWGKDCYTIFSSDNKSPTAPQIVQQAVRQNVQQVVFDGKPLPLNSQ